MKLRPMEHFMINLFYMETLLNMKLAVSRRDGHGAAIIAVTSGDLPIL